MKTILKTIAEMLIGAIGGLAYLIRDWAILILAVILLITFIAYSWDN